MYFILFHAITDAVEQLQQAQKDAEDCYLDTNESTNIITLELDKNE